MLRRATTSLRPLKAPPGADDNVRQVIVKYMKAKMAQGEDIDSKIEGRIIIADK